MSQGINVLNYLSVWAMAVLVLLGLFLFDGWYTVDQTERGVLLRMGAVVAVSEPGAGLKIPILDSVARISVETKTEQFGHLDAYSKDQQPAKLRLSVTYKIPPDQVKEVYANFRSEMNLVERTLARDVPQVVETVFGQFNAVSAIQERARLSQEINTALQAKVQLPLALVSVQLENIDFSDAYERSIEERMQAEVEVQKIKQNAEREKITAEITVIKAKAQADSALAQARAEADAIKLKGEAEAAAIEARGKALKDNPQLVNLVTAEKWNGQLPVTMVPNSTVPMIDIWRQEPQAAPAPAPTHATR